MSLVLSWTFCVLGLDLDPKSLALALLFCKSLALALGPMSLASNTKSLITSLPKMTDDELM